MDDCHAAQFQDVYVLVRLVHPLRRDLQRIIVPKDVLPLAVLIRLGRPKHIHERRSRYDVSERLRLREEAMPYRCEFVFTGLPHARSENGPVVGRDREVIARPNPFSPSARGREGEGLLVRCLVGREADVAVYPVLVSATSSSTSEDHPL